MIDDPDNDSYAGAAFVLGDNRNFPDRIAHLLLEKWPRERRRTMTHAQLHDLLKDAGEICMAYGIDNTRDQMAVPESVPA